MRIKFSGAVVLLLGLVACLPLAADNETIEPAAPLTVDEVYLGLSMGPLRAAQLVDLPEELVLRAGEVTIGSAQIAAEIEKAVEELQIHAQLQENAFFVLESLATEALLLQEARAWAESIALDTTKETADSLIQIYLESLAAEVTVSDEELRAWFEASKEMFGGATYDQVAEILKLFLISEKRNQVVKAHMDSLSERTVVEVDAAWVEAQAASALDNPVDKARRSGKPTVVDFGAEGCGPCDEMAPILGELREQYAEQCNVLIIQVRDEPILAARYGIESIPVQVFFDQEGKEVFRHVGFFPKEQILAQLAELGTN